MAVTDRRTREKEETRARILDAARELFAREGYHAVTMRRLAQAIGYTPTAIYFHFEDKAALFRELCDTDFKALAAGFQRIGRIDDPVERLRRIGRAYVEFALEHPHHYKLMFMSEIPPEAASEGLHAGDPSQDAYAFLLMTVQEMVRSGRLKAEHKDPHLLAQCCWGLVHGIASLHVTHASNPATEKFIDWRPARRTAAHAIDGMLSGILREVAA